MAERISITMFTLPQIFPHGCHVTSYDFDGVKKQRLWTICVCIAFCMPDIVVGIGSILYDCEGSPRLGEVCTHS